MKILSAQQIRLLDQHTIATEKIPSIALMESAALAFSEWFTSVFPGREKKLIVLAGPGNNGGDGLAIARLLAYDFYDVEAYWFIAEKVSNDAAANFERLRDIGHCPVSILQQPFHLPAFPESAIIIDALFGNGMDRPLVGDWKLLVERINGLPNEKIAVDLPSGLVADAPTLGIAVRAGRTFSFELPKLAFFVPENQPFVGNWEVRPIGLDATMLEASETCWHTVDAALVKPMLHSRQKNDHKGSFGHALLVAGSYGKIGAAILAAKAGMRSGTGLMTIHAPKCAYEILQIAFPEAMVSVDEHQFVLSGLREDLSKFSAIGIGPGLGTNELTVSALTELLRSADKPLVIDADALNILSGQPSRLANLPRQSILTPHPKEFERLFGATHTGWERLGLLVRKATELGVFIILKGGNTAIACPDGQCFFNTTGNPGMATAGSGDVLTGILTGLLAQGYLPKQACLLGVYLHGLAGDVAAESLQQESLLASDITTCLGRAFQMLKSFES